MSWLFSKSPISVEKIKTDLKTYYQLKNEHIDYYVDDYVVIKPALLTLHDVVYTTLPTHAYIVSFHIDNMIGAFVKNNEVIIGPLQPHCYQRAEFDLLTFPDLLTQFVHNPPVDNDPFVPLKGVLVKPRQHHCGFTFTTTTCVASNTCIGIDANRSNPLTTIVVMKEPAIVMNNNHGLLTIAGYDTENQLCEQQVYWYQVTLYF